MENKIYPVFYKGKVYQENDVNDIFRAFYHSKDSLDSRVSVYVSEDLRITPDGEWVE